MSLDKHKQRFPLVAKGAGIAINEFIMQFFRHSDAFANKIPEYPVYEGYSMAIVQMGKASIGEMPDQEVNDSIAMSSSLQQIVGTGEIVPEDIRMINLEEFRAMLLDIATGLTESRGRTMFSQLDDILDKAGRTTDAEGKPFTFELWLHGIESIDFEFDDNGNPLYPTLVIHPAMSATVEKVFAEVEKDPILRQKLNDVLNRKREAYYAKEANRKLAD